MPPRETLANFAATGATLAIHLSIHALPRWWPSSRPTTAPDCPVAIVYRASWPDERVLRGTLADIEAKLAASPIERTALILVGPVLGSRGFREQRALRRRLCPPFQDAGLAGRAGLMQRGHSTRSGLAHSGLP